MKSLWSCARFRYLAMACLFVSFLFAGWYFERSIRAVFSTPPVVNSKARNTGKLYLTGLNTFLLPKDFAERVGLTFDTIKRVEQPRTLPPLQATLALDVDDQLRIPSIYAGKWAIQENMLARQRAVGDINGNRGKVNKIPQLKVWATVYEEDLPALKSLPKPYPWNICLSTQADVTCPGQMLHVEAVVDPDQHTARVTGTVRNEGELLRPGQFVTVTIMVAPDTDDLLLPAEAVVVDGSASLIFVQKEAGPQSFDRKSIHVVSRSREYVVLKGSRDGLRVGQKVVAQGAMLLQQALKKQQSERTTEKVPSETNAP